MTEEEEKKIRSLISTLDSSKRYNLPAIANFCNCQKDYQSVYLLLEVLFYLTEEKILNVAFYVDVSSTFEVGPFDNICKIPDKFFDLNNQEVTIYPKQIQIYYQLTK